MHNSLFLVSRGCGRDREDRTALPVFSHCEISFGVQNTVCVNDSTYIVCFVDVLFHLHFCG